MKDEQFRKVEKQLYNYYERQKRIKALEKEIELLKEQYCCLEVKLRNNQYTLEEESSSPSFEERVQTSGDGTSYAEKQMLKLIEEDIREQTYIKRKIIKIEQKVREIERNTIRLKSNLEMLEEDNRRLIEFKYKDKKDIGFIASELNMSQRKAFRFRREVIEEVARFVKGE